MGRVSCEHERQYYAKRRLAKLRTVCPDLPDDVMERVGLRQLSYSVRRAGKLVGKLQRSEAREGVRSITEKVRPECGQRVYQATLVGSDPIKGTFGHGSSVTTVRHRCTEFRSGCDVCCESCWA